MKQESHELIRETWKYCVFHSNSSLRVIFEHAFQSRNCKQAPVLYGDLWDQAGWVQIPPLPFFKSSPRYMFIDVRERGRGRGTEREREKGKH